VLGSGGDRCGVWLSSALGVAGNEFFVCFCFGLFAGLYQFVLQD